MDKKIVIALLTLILCVLLGGCGTAPNQNTHNEILHSTDAPDYEVAQIIDASRFAHISKQELTTLLGEPTSVIEKNARVGDNCLFRDSFDRYYREIFFYENSDKSEYQILLVNDTVYSFIYWSPKHADNSAEDIKFTQETDIFAMFGIIPSESANKLNTSNKAANFETVSEKVWRFDIGSINRTGSTFQNVVITYDVRSNPIEENTEAQGANSSHTVYVTPSGKRYHFDSNCGGSNSSATTLDKAKSMGLSPCNKCAN